MGVGVRFNRYALRMSDGDLKVFISWSGDLSREITKVIRDWLPKMFDRVDPWMSAKDIQAGTRGLRIIEERLRDSEFGIIVVTAENMEKTWLNFEAGALSNRFGDDVLARVVPIMADFDDVYQIKGPISQFQAVKLNKDGILSLLESIAAVTATTVESVRARFEWSWDEFAAAIEQVRTEVGEQPVLEEPTEIDLLRSLIAKVDAVSRDRPHATFTRSPALVDANESTRLLRNVLESRLKKYGVKHSGIIVEETLGGEVIVVVTIASDMGKPELYELQTILSKAAGTDVTLRTLSSMKSSE